ncbi:MAG: sigma-70 family RNA polymerase sigma factor [Gemmataceae bacterium]|nr:sigma-70 family RNA polymerase sigma factor [Gemmataceae bacterium]
MTPATPEPTDTRASLLVRLRDPADRVSWGLFAAVYGPLVKGYCRHHGLQDADADDVSQEVLLRVTRSIGGFEYDPGRGRFRDWLGTVARNAVRRFHGRQAGAPRGTGADDRPELDGADPGDPDPEWVARYQAGLLAAACDRARPHFEPHTWRAFERAWLDQVPAADVAAELGLPIHAVYVAKSRVVGRLRAELAYLAEDMPHAGPPE